MKFVTAVAGIVALLSVADAFTTGPSSASRRSSPVDASTSTTSLKVTTLDQWQLLDNGSVVGSVRGHPVLNDGDIITTSPLAAPASAKSSNTVTTLTGSTYQLGNPMMSGAAAAAAANSGPGVGRSTFVQVAGTASLFAGGVALGAQLGGFGKPEMTIPEAKIAMAFPGAVTNDEFTKRVTERLGKYGYGPTTLVATSLCCDEVNRPLEKALTKAYDEPFVMGGLAGFPFGGITSFGAMAHHIPDGGSCLVVYGPHVGIDSMGSVGTVNRRGRAKGGACCGSAAAALGKIKKGSMVPKADDSAPPAVDSLDAQQAYVNAQLAPYGERLLAADDRNIELPYALYDAQKKMMDGIVAKGASAMEGNGYIAMLGGIQINTPDNLSDYFLPLNFELRDSKGNKVKDLLWA